MKMRIEKLLSIFLWVVSLHSFGVGIGLIFLPTAAFEYLGFLIPLERFFTSQGGVFHICMSICYALAAYDKKRFQSLIIFSLIVKLIAAVFLFAYFIFISSQLLIIFSAITDLAMGIIIWLLHRRLFEESYFRDTMA